MCYRVRERDVERRRTEQALPPSEMMSPRPRRLAGAVAAAVVAIVTLVALLVPGSLVS